MINKNFKKITIKDQKIIILRHRFDKRGFAVVAYSRAHRLDKGKLTKVLNGELKGAQKNAGADLKRVFLQLKQDCIWQGKMPWEK